MEKMEITSLFFSLYPEFKDKVNPERIEALKDKSFLLFPVLNKGTSNTHKTACCMVIAHIITSGANNTATQMQVGQGMTGAVTSASIGGVSVGISQAPYKDMYEYYFSSTPYGLEFLAWLASIGGPDYIN